MMWKNLMNRSKKKILFLYSEIAGYLLSCVEHLTAHYEVEAHIVKWPVNKEAPFVFKSGSGVTLYERPDYNRHQLLELAEKISPDAIVCSGWLDKDYLYVASKMKHRATTVMALDNHWHGTIKQIAASLLFPFTYGRTFKHAWVPGEPQEYYAKKLRFKPDNIQTGYYSADVNHFRKFYQKFRNRKKEAFPKRFIYTGRYYDFKGLPMLWEAFAELYDAGHKDWELWCLGTGDLLPVAHPGIKHKGFIQPADMEEYIGNTGVFVLPSLREPWGVVVHEFATAGFPLICSDAVGSASAFLHDRSNGYIFNAGNKEALKKILGYIMSMTNEELFLMGERSADLAMSVTPERWSSTAMKFINEKSYVRN